MGSALAYAGGLLGLAGALLLVRPSARLGVPTRARAAALVTIGLGVVVGGFLLPTPESRAPRRGVRLDEFMPVWQFSEVHSRRIAASPDRAYDAIRKVRADEIFLFNTLTAIRRGFRPAPPSILNAAGGESLLDLATRTTFVRLVDDPPHELVVGTVIIAPPDVHGRLTADLFRRDLPPGFALATANFVVMPDRGGSMVTTETRVFANTAWTRRRFAVYWRIIYPGSALIRRMWLRAIERRATESSRTRPSSST